jgi:CIC family chloride channel protein
MAGVYSVPLGGALFALEVPGGTLALRLMVPALAASLIATKTASFVVPNAPLYTSAGLRNLGGRLPLGGHRLGLWSVAFVRAIA